MLSPKMYNAWLIACPKSSYCKWCDQIIHRLICPTICQSCGNQLTFRSVIWTISSAFQAKCHFNSMLKSWAHAAITAKISSWTWTTAITKYLSSLHKFKIINKTEITTKILEFRFQKQRQQVVLSSWGNMESTMTRDLQIRFFWQM